MLIKFTQWIVVGIFFLPGVLFAATIPAGVANEALWFSKDPFFAGEQVVIHTLLYNSSTFPVNGTLLLHDGTTTIADKSFALSGGGASLIVSFPWTVTRGAHDFYVEITSFEFAPNEQFSTTSAPAKSRTEKVVRIADLDTDGDGVGNTIDIDDDGDMLSDKEEVKLGTNPLTPDSDGDGIGDARDTHPLEKEAVPLKVEDDSSLPSVFIDKLPESVRETTVPIIGAIEGYRLQAAKDGAEVVDRVMNDFALPQASTTASSSPSLAHTAWEIFREGAVSRDVIHSPLGYTKLFFALLWQFIPSHTYAFYLLILFLCYVLIRVTWAIVH